MFKTFGFQTFVYRFSNLIWGHVSGLYSPAVFWQNTGKTVPADTAGQTVAVIADQSTNILDFIQATGASQPVVGSIPQGGVLNQLPNNYINATNGAIAAAGSELIPDGLFTSNMGGFASASTGTGTAVWSNSGGVGHLAIEGGASGVGIARISVSVTAGVTYMLQMTSEVVGLTRTEVGTTAGGADILSISGPSVGGRIYSFTPAATGTIYLQFRKNTNGAASIYVVSLRQQRLPTLVQSGSTALSTPIRTLLTVISTGTDSTTGLPYYDLRVNCPVTGSTGGTNYYLSSTVANSPPSLSGQTWSSSIWLALISGSTSGVFSVNLVERTAAGAGVGSAHQSSAFAITSTLTKFSYEAVLLDGGVTSVSVQTRLNLASTTGGAVMDYTLRIAGAQQERSATASPTRVVTAATPWLVTAPGVPSVLVPYGAGDDFMALAAVGFGTATQGCYPAAGKNWSIMFYFCVTTDGTIVAQRGAVDANAMFSGRVASGTLRFFLAGTDNNSGIAVNDDHTHIASVTCTNGVVTYSIDGAARVTASVGAAAAESQVLTLMARTAASPANFATGFADLVCLLDYAWTEVVEQQTYQAAKAIVGGP